jgi:hypothetical protein
LFETLAGTAVLLQNAKSLVAITRPTESRLDIRNPVVGDISLLYTWLFSLGNGERDFARRDLAERLFGLGGE